MKGIRYLVVHCSDTPNDREVTAAEIHGWHVKRGWDGIGYNAVIRRDGTVEAGRPPYWVGAHVQGANGVSLGVCLVGRDHFTEVQMEALEGVLRGWLAVCPQAVVVGHRELDPRKTCPNFDAALWWAGRGRA